MPDSSPRKCSNKSCQAPLSPSYEFNRCNPCRIKTRESKQNQVARQRQFKREATEKTGNRFCCSTGCYELLPNGHPVNSCARCTRRRKRNKQLRETEEPSRHELAIKPTKVVLKQFISPRSPRADAIPTTTSSTCHFTPDNSDTIVSYSFITGIGEPSPDLGLAGDIYLDMTPSSYQLYGKVIGWQRWFSPRETTALVQHPEYGYHFLWCSVEYMSMGWLPINRLTTGQCIPPFI